MKIFLDAKQTPKDGYTLIVRSPDHFKDLFKKWSNHITHVSFSDDLKDRNDITGLDLARWLVNMNTIHTGMFLKRSFTFRVHDSSLMTQIQIRNTLNKFWREV